MWQALRTLFANARALVEKNKPSGRKPFTDDGSSVARVVIVGLVSSEKERDELASLGFDEGWEVQFADTCAEALAASDPRRVPVILCDRDLPSADWRDAVQTLASSSRPACVILLSSVVDDALWEEVIRHGGYDILAKPLRRNEVVRVVKLARSFWSSMMKMPAYSGKTGSLSSN